MDMKSYILIGGGLLICLVLLHALFSAWRGSRRVPTAEDAEVSEALDLDIEADAATTTTSGDEALAEDLANQMLEEELTGETLADESVSAAGVPPMLMERTAADETDTGNDAGSTAPTPTEGVASPMEASPKETAHVDGEEASGVSATGAPESRRGRRIDVRGKRTEPTVPRAMRSEFHEFTKSEPPKDKTNGSSDLDDIIVLWLFAKPGRVLDGEGLLKAFVSHGLKCDADRVFKKSDPRCGGFWYTVANGVEPGTFDISRPAALATPGIVMLLRFGDVRDLVAAFENMLDVAQDLAISLGGELKDEHRSDMSAQTIEHYRQRIRDFKRTLLRA